MQAAIHYVLAIDGKKLFVRSWFSQKHALENTTKGIVQIFHDVAEHSERYKETAKSLCDEGYIVVAHDHRGHGGTAADASELGRFADHYGWQLVISDVHAVNKDIKERFPDLPVIGIGHGLGSFMLQTYATRHPERIDGIALSAPSFTNPLFVRMATLLATVEKLRLGRRKECRLIQQLIYGGFNRQFRPNRTPFDWLSRNPQVADSYMADPRCGFVGSTQMWQDILGGIMELYSTESLNFFPTKIPYYLFAGSDDPMSNASNGFNKLITWMRQIGVTNLSTRVYPEGRHEMLHEVNNQEVLRDLLKWLNKICPTTQARMQPELDVMPIASNAAA